MIRRPPRSTQSRSSAASDVYKRQGKTAHLFIHDDFAGITHANTKAHDRITVHAGHAFNAADAIAFGQHGNHHDFLFGSELVCHGFRSVSYTHLTLPTTLCRSRWSPYH